MNRAKEVSTFFLIFTVLFGFGVRLYPILKQDFPLVDGGMFYTMIRDLQAAHFSLPLFTTYNQIQIPYAYPPLAFYIAGGINSAAGISILKIIQWMPLIANLFTLPIFYLFTEKILRSAPRAALATLIFSLTPNSYWWTIVGGGLTRSLGTLFFILAVFCIYQMYREKKTIWVAASIVAGALVVLSHLSWALQTAVAAMLLWWFFGRSKQSLVHSIIVGAGVLLLTSPWWASVTAHHGIGVFMQAFQVNHSRWLAWTILFALSFTGEYTTVIAVFALAGIFIEAAKKNYFFVLWALLCLISDPRGGTYAAVFPFAALAMSALADGIARALTTNSAENPEAWMSSLNSRAGKFFFGFFIILFLYNAYNVSENLSGQALNQSQRDALEWIRVTTDQNASFLVFDEQGNPLLSPFVEWFPALSERRSLTTIQGTEWLRGDLHYNTQLPRITQMRGCLAQDVSCVQNLSDTMSADYLVIAANGRVPLLASLETHSEFELFYASPSVTIYKVNP